MELRRGWCVARLVKAVGRGRGCGCGRWCRSWWLKFGVGLCRDTRYGDAAVEVQSLRCSLRDGATTQMEHGTTADEQISIIDWPENDGQQTDTMTKSEQTREMEGGEALRNLSPSVH